MATKQQIETDALIPPGEHLREELEARGLTQKELARRMGRPPQVVSEICRGKREITADIALDLERALETPAYIWMNLESQYQLRLARQRRQLSATG
ncbi:MAG: HigA family addiction module antidote protein [Chloroflexi bacterium]|nr:HigA family addiction module antidote protein [Chloroflexota bacterium]